MTTYTAIFTKTEATTLKNTFVIVVEYEHGDADATTQETINLPMSVSDFEGFCKKFDEVAESISDARSNGERIDVSDEKYGKFAIPYAYDVCYQDHTASMSITSIKYFDKDGVEFDVEMKEN